MEDFVKKSGLIKENINIIFNGKRKGMSIAGVIFLILIFAIAAVVIPNMRRAGGPNTKYPPQKRCYTNMRVILGAVEMYNMEHKEMLRSIQSYDCVKGGILVEEGYLKKPIVPPSDKCEYYTKGVLPEKGAIFCTEHGCVEKPKELKKLGIIEDTKPSN
jgi:competence protein ComGC